MTLATTVEKLDLIHRLLSNPTYTTDSALYKLTAKALLRLSKSTLANLQIIVDCKTALTVAPKPEENGHAAEKEGLA